LLGKSNAFQGGLLAEGVREWSVEQVFGPERDEVTGKWKRLYNKELCAL
jgi:hypothetical protein